MNSQPAIPRPVPLLIRVLSLLCLLLSLPAARAQWVQQAFTLKPGWNAVYLHLDPSYDTLNNLVGTNLLNPISEVWLWRPDPATLQFITDPAEPTGTSSQWSSWARTNGVGSSLQRLVGNYAYLVHNTNSVNYSWTLKGKPLTPHYQWTSKGLNFIGFPVPEPNGPGFATFLDKAPVGMQSANATYYQYVGGAFSTLNPATLTDFTRATVKRGQAYWVKAENYYNRYYGAFELLSEGDTGLNFGDSVSLLHCRVRNLTTNTITVTLSFSNSLAAPANQATSTSNVPLLLRGTLNQTNLTYAYSELKTNEVKTFVIPGKGSVPLYFGVNRMALTNADGVADAPGALRAGVLRLTDSLGFTQVDMGVTAQAGSVAGLWVGGAAVNQVRHYLKTYQTNADGSVSTTAGGQYVTTGVNTNLGATAAAYPLRLILHSDTPGDNTFLLQRAYLGLDTATNLIVATAESRLDPKQLATARRVSAAHLPFTATNTLWRAAGRLQPGTNLVVTVALPYNDHGANPFLHTYHPDHDNLDATFKTELPQGYESYQIARQFTLTFHPANDFDSLTRSATTLSGTYDEAVTFLGRGTEARRFEVRGGFTLNRITPVPTLSRP